jgi:hypothetical protein
MEKTKDRKVSLCLLVCNFHNKGLFGGALKKKLLH